jgi:nucleoid-associated protein YgaU
MSIISFFKDAGEKLFGHKEATAVAAAVAAPDDATLRAQAEAANQTAATAISTYIGSQNLKVAGLAVGFDGANGAVSVAGEAVDQATKEKVVLCCGNVHGVHQVHDGLTVSEPTEESSYYTVERGDTLSAIAKEEYGNANEYMKIYEANRPMLSHPDKIYPGQLLRIPA